MKIQLRRAGACVGMVVALVVACFGESPAAANDSAAVSGRAVPSGCTPKAKCCVVCRSTFGKACGEACIEKKEACPKKAGCACDEADVCPD
jgi:hypothetical protein